MQGIGCVKITKAIDSFGNNDVESRGYLEKKLVFCFGSHIASQLLLPSGEENLLSLSELKKAQEVFLIFYFYNIHFIQWLLDFSCMQYGSTFSPSQQIATCMVLEYGWSPDNSPTIYYHSNAVNHSSFNYSFLVDLFLEYHMLIVLNSVMLVSYNSYFFTE